MFALELILREVKLKSLTPIIISAVFATITAKVLLNYLGVEATYIFFLPQYTLKTPLEIIFYLLLGLVAGVVAIIFTKSLYGIEDIFEKIKAPEFVKPAIGGLFVGIIGLILFLSSGNPYVFGIGFETMDMLFGGQIVFAVIFALIFLKIIATSLTLGSGGSGGVFTPALFIGSMTGGAFGTVIHKIFPTITATYEGYAIVGMAAVFAGGSNAILTAIVLVFEMTGNYMIILPVMLACVISTSFYKFYMEDTIYTVKLRHRGIIIEQEMDVNQMKTITVQDIMNTEVETVNEYLSLKKIIRKKIIKTGHMAFPVVRAGNYLVGIVTHSDFDKIGENEHETLRVKDVMTTELFTAQPDERIEDVLIKTENEELSHFPVVNPNKPQEIVGFFLPKETLSERIQKKEQIKI